jgi:hypothetical protein
MPDLKNNNDNSLFFDLVYHSVFPNPDTIDIFIPAQFFATIGKQLHGKRRYRSQNSNLIFMADLLQLPFASGETSILYLFILSQIANYIRKRTCGFTPYFLDIFNVGKLFELVNQGSFDETADFPSTLFTCCFDGPFHPAVNSYSSCTYPSGKPSPDLIAHI